MHKAEVLRNNALFRDLTGDALEKIGKLAICRNVPKGTLLFSQGDPGDSFYGIISGCVRVSAMSPEGREIHIVELGDGDTFGEVALLDGGRRTASATVSADATLFLLARRHFRALLEGDQLVALHIIERLCERLRWTSELVEDMSFLPVPAQIAKRLWLLLRDFGTDVGDGRSLRVSQADLATFLGLSRQAVNGHLQTWQDEGWLGVSRGKLLVRDIDRLKQAFTGGV
jgi:CRP-like cAMP-binding protein